MRIVTSTALFLIVILALTSTNLVFTNISTSLPSFTIAAYAQTPRGPGASPFNNATDSGLPSDNSTDFAPPANATDLNPSLGDNSTDLGASIDNNSTSSGTGTAGNLTTGTTNPTGTGITPQTTQSATTPEFGPVVLVVLVISIMSIIIISTRTKLRFSQV